MKQCKQCKKEFETNELETDLNKRMGVPEIMFCLSCRRQKRLGFWPFGNFYIRKCDLSGETIVTTFPPDTQFPVYKRDHWYSDKWKPPEMDMDFSKTFFEQLVELQSKTPHYHMLGDSKSTNCDYSDDSWESKNCYLCRSFYLCEEMYYTYRNIRVKHSIDTTFCFDLEQCYDCTYCFNSYNLHYSVNSRNCLDSWFLYDCRGCTSCFMSWNLRNKKYCIRNKQYTKEEYEKEIEKIGLLSFSEMQKLRMEFSLHIKDDVIHSQDFNVQIENSTGNFLEKCKNCIDGVLTSEIENAYDSLRGLQNKDCVSTSGLLNGELCSQVVQSTNCYNVQVATYCVDCSNSQYLDQCQGSEDCFGCVGLNKKKYCILNKQYSQEEYNLLKKRIIDKMKTDGEYGEFFPWAMMYNGYNASLAFFYYPSSKEKIVAMGAKWEEPQESTTEGVPADTLPDNIKNTDESWVGKIIICPETNRPFKIVKQEYQFYKTHGIPLPHHYPDFRNKERYNYLTAINPREIKCTNCDKNILTCYPETWNYKKIFCHECYNKEIL